MNDTIRIRLSLGLLMVAVIHAILLGVVFTALHQQALPKLPQPRFSDTLNPTPTPQVGPIEKLPEPQTVNLRAQGEMKQGILGNRLGRLLPVRQPSVYEVPKTVTRASTCTTNGNCPPTANKTDPPSQPASEPTSHQKQQTAVDIQSALPGTLFDERERTPAPIVAPMKPRESKGYQLALFVSSDSQSRQLVQWFEKNLPLTQLRERCEFQVYTPENPLYRERFATLVPRDQFPVVLLQDSQGGHIHAAGRAMIPSTPEELYSDLKYGYELYEQALQAEKTGAIRSMGYSWDDAITPTMSLFSQDCPDGYCPIDIADRWRPGSRVRDKLFDEVRDSRGAILWASASELATIALIVIAVILLGFILIKRGV
ncbi:hypothetical protein SH449x_002723 [Pirellulaceae bacterium SH449]